MNEYETKIMLFNNQNNAYCKIGNFKFWMLFGDNNFPSQIIYQLDVPYNQNY